MFPASRLAVRGAAKHSTMHRTDPKTKHVNNAEVERYLVAHEFTTSYLAIHASKGSENMSWIRMCLKVTQPAT